MPFTFNPFTATLDYYSPGDTTVAIANVKANVAPVEAPDGIRTEFTVPEAYIAGSLTVYLNGIAEAGVGETSGTTFEFDEAPYAGDVIRLNYAVEGEA